MKHENKHLGGPVWLFCYVEELFYINKLSKSILPEKVCMKVESVKTLKSFKSYYRS